MKDIKVIGKIYQTTDYDQFKYRKDNRLIKTNHVLELAKSINKMGLRQPITVDVNLRVQDGQHRLAACKKLGIPVFYIIDAKSLSTAEIAELQSTTEEWKQYDYTRSFSSDENPNYEKYGKFAETYSEFAHSCRLIMLTGETKASSSSKLVEAFKQGLLKVKSYEKAVLLADTLRKLSPYYKGYNRRSFVLAFITMMQNKDFSFSRLLRKMPKRCKEIMDFSRTEDYLTVMQDMYNWKETKKVYFH
jgi:hypothetical protein